MIIMPNSHVILTVMQNDCMQHAAGCGKAMGLRNVGQLHQGGGEEHHQRAGHEGPPAAAQLLQQAQHRVPGRSGCATHDEHWLP